MVKTILYLRVTMSDGDTSAHITSEIDVVNNRQSVAAVKALSKALYEITREP